MTEHQVRWPGADVTQAELESAAVDALEAHGWLVRYQPRNVVETVYGTPGEPVIRGVHDGRALWLAVRSGDVRLREWEAAWMGQLAQVPDAIVRVLRPETFASFTAELTRTAGRLGNTGTLGLEAELRRAELEVVGSGMGDDHLGQRGL